MSKDPFQTRSTAGSTDLSRQGSAVQETAALHCHGAGGGAADRAPRTLTGLGPPLF